MLDQNHSPINEIKVDEKFESFLKKCHRCQKTEDQAILRKAYNFAKIVHSNQTRYNGDCFINHPVEVARIACLDIGLSTKSAVAALLHDTVTNGDADFADIEMSFGKEITTLVERLARIKGTSNFFNINKSEVYRLLLIGISQDIRIIYIKIADRLHNMRTLASLEPERKLKIANETMYVYVPLAERLGLFGIKSELEDLAFKYLQPNNYREIAKHIKNTELKNIMNLNRFALPIIADLFAADIDFDIISRQKSIYSIWKKIKRKKISFDEVYDLFAIRIIFNPKSEETEKQEAFKIFDIIKSKHEIKADRIRNWIDEPKENGYEALHLTVKEQNTRWVEIQIRSTRMDDIAEHGFASHWKYKGVKYQKVRFDEKINKLKQQFESVDENTQFNYSDFNLLFSTEIITYTPKGKEVILDVGCTVLDFAFAIHSTLGYKCIGAKVNKVLVPLDHNLQNGDSVFVLTSQNQEPKSEWLEKVKSPKAKSKLQEYFKKQKINEKEKGQNIIAELLEENDITPSRELINTLISNFNAKNKHDLYINVSNGSIPRDKLETVIKRQTRWRIRNFFVPVSTQKTQKIDNYITEKCCNPIPGDQIIGIKKDDAIVIHQINCPKITSKNITENEVLQITWKLYKAKSFYTSLQINAENNMGLFHQISRTLAYDLEVNIKSLHFDTVDNGLEMNGWLGIYVLNKEHLEKVINKLKNISGIQSVERIIKY